MLVSFLISYFGDSTRTDFGTLQEIWVFGKESHWLPELRSPRDSDLENPKQLPSDFTWGLSASPTVLLVI